MAQIVLLNKIRTLFRHPMSCLIKLFSFPFWKMVCKEYHWTDYISMLSFITPQYLAVKGNVHVRYGCRIEGVTCYNNQRFSPTIVFEKGVSIEQNLHLTCAQSIVIGKNTSIAANVTITDIHHRYDNPLIPIEQQDIMVLPVIIGEGCKIYNNVTILPGVQIGNHVTVGANSVVNRNLPDFCVAVGVPAFVVKRFDTKRNEWRRTDKNGIFV